MQISLFYLTSWEQVTICRCVMQAFATNNVMDRDVLILLYYWTGLYLNIAIHNWNICLLPSSIHVGKGIAKCLPWYHSAENNNPQLMPILGLVST